MSLSTATVVSPISRTKEGFFWRRRTRLPGTIPRELSLSSRFLDFGVMNTIRPSSPRTASDKRVTSGLISVRILSQHSPRGIGLPWGQTGGCPRNVQTISVTVFVRMCSNLQALLSTWLLSRSNRLLSSTSARRCLRMITRARSSPGLVSLTSSPDAYTRPAVARSSMSFSGWSSSVLRRSWDRVAIPSSRRVHTSSRISSCAYSVIVGILSQTGIERNSPPSTRARETSNGIGGNRRGSSFFPWGTRSGTRALPCISDIDKGGTGFSRTLPLPLKMDAEDPGGEIDGRADQHGEREDEQGHPRRHFSPLFLDDDEKIREAGDEQGDRDEAYDNLEMGQKSCARHVEQARGAVIPSQKSDQECLGGFGGQVQRPDDDRLRDLLHPQEPPHAVCGEQDEGPDHKEGYGLPEVPLDASHRLDREVSHLRHPDRRNLEDKIGGFARYDLGRQISHQKDYPDDDPHPRYRRGGTDVREHPENDAQLSRAGDAEGEKERYDHALLPGFQDPGRKRCHGVAPEPQDHGEHRLSVAADLLEDPVHHDREAGQVPGVFQDPEPQKEGPYDRQHDGDRVGERHGDDPVGAHEHVPDHPPGDCPLHRPGGRRHDPFSEHALLENIHQEACPEDPDELVRQEQDKEQDRNPEQGIHGVLPEHLLPVPPLRLGRFLPQFGEERIDPGETGLVDPVGDVIPDFLHEAVPHGVHLPDILRADIFRKPRRQGVVPAKKHDGEGPFADRRRIRQETLHPGDGALH